MDGIQRLKTEISLLEHVRKRLGQDGKKENEGYRFKSTPDDKTPSLLVYTDTSRGYCDFSGRLASGTIIDFEKNFTNKTEKEVIKDLLQEYKIKGEKKEFKKSPMWDDIVNDFEKFRCTGGNTLFQRFLGTRGVSIDTIKIYKDNLQEIAKEIATIDGLYLEKGVYKDCIIFPCYDEYQKIVGMKVRRVDGEKINTKNGEIKSKAHKNTGVLYEKEAIKEDVVFICEGETDYIILKMLGFSSLIGNLGGVSSNTDKIQKLVKNTQTIICLYDNDDAGRKGAKGLQEKIGRPIRVVEYPKIDGKDKYDINDLFKMGWREDDFKQLIESSHILDDTQEKSIEIYKNTGLAKIMENKLPIIFLRKSASFYDYETGDFRSLQEAYMLTGIQPKKLQEMVQEGDIQSYYDLCYLHGGKEYHYNTLREESILQKGEIPEIHPDLKFFIENLCGNKKENYDWLYKAILYKYTHINDVKVPAVVFTSAGGVGKGTFINLLRAIFGKENIQEGLSTRDLLADKDSYSGGKLIVEFDELEAGNHKEAKLISAKLKNMIFKNPMNVRVLYKNAENVENIAWFIISSNDPKPIMLDSGSSGNRRYSIIEGGRPLTRDEGVNLNDVILKDKKIVQDFLSWLFVTFPEVPAWTSIPDLDNEEKNNLVFGFTSSSEQFFDWFDEKYPNINRITIKEKESLLQEYRLEQGENGIEYDKLYDVRYFNKELPRRVKYKNLRVRGEIKKGYEIIGKRGSEFEANKFGDLPF